ncbi:unnamed protein product [Rotaria sp. Silwood1]|nr:unnamed protein product [Rotaria sp. Silwood1]CAF1088114.1 unnamed protein product [Rotaria sp. Silwood1]CAF1110427.1 unnamed protein product [Rotaria sp. Silwood1]CAF3446859.1 unnamed protein product [Rotaria sp. Silwood1]CAF5122471.1 unnamed protein product [Rotaria sp. Silwood1]
MTIPNAYSPTIKQPERVSLTLLETITDTLLPHWQELAVAFQFNPDLQLRTIIVYGCISKTTSDREIKALLRILVKALESFSHIDLIDSLIMCLTRLLSLLSTEYKIQKFNALDCFINTSIRTSIKRKPFKWKFKQLHATMALSFKSNFTFVAADYFIKGRNS